MKAHNVGFMSKSWGPKPKATKILTEGSDELQGRLQFLQHVLTKVDEVLQRDPSTFGGVTTNGTDPATFTINLRKGAGDTVRSFDLARYYRSKDIDGAIKGTLAVANEIAQNRGFVRHSNDDQR
jgi:hypothetical protein